MFGTWLGCGGLQLPACLSDGLMAKRRGMRLWVPHAQGPTNPLTLHASPVALTVYIARGTDGDRDRDIDADAGI